MSDNTTLVSEVNDLADRLNAREVTYSQMHRAVPRLTAVAGKQLYSDDHNLEKAFERLHKAVTEAGEREQITFYAIQQTLYGIGYGVALKKYGPEFFRAIKKKL